MHPSTEQKKDTASNVHAAPKAIHVIANRCLQLLADELNKADTQVFVRTKLIHPLVHLIYTELFPYLAALFITIIMILLVSIMTFMFFMMFYFRR